MLMTFFFFDRRLFLISSQKLTRMTILLNSSLNWRIIATLGSLAVLFVKGNNTLKRKIYQKLIKIDCIIQFKISAPLNYKMAALNSFINRAYLICSKAYIQDELNNIVCIAKDHGFPLNDIHHTI